MFLSKHSNGIYYLFFRDELGKRRKVSTGCRLKSDAFKFLQSFKVSEQERKLKLQRVSLGAFAQDFLAYSQSVHTPKTRRSFAVAFREFIRKLGVCPSNSYLQASGVGDDIVYL